MAKCLRCGAGNEWIQGKATRTDDALAAEVAELRAFKDAVMGWREYDWPEGFCRRTAEMLAQHANSRSNTELKEGE